MFADDAGLDISSAVSKQWRAPRRGVPDVNQARLVRRLHRVGWYTRTAAVRVAQTGSTARAHLVRHLNTRTSEVRC